MVGLTLPWSTLSELCICLSLKMGFTVSLVSPEVSGAQQASGLRQSPALHKAHENHHQQGMDWHLLTAGGTLGELLRRQLEAHDFHSACL